MKRWVILVVALVSLLAGCGNSGEESGGTNEGDKVTEPRPSVEGGLYVPDSAVEQQTGSAVKYYALPSGSYEELLPMGENLLLLQGSGDTRLELLTGSSLAGTVKLELSGAVSAEDGSVQVGMQGVAYLDSHSGALVFLNPFLREVSRLQLPADMVGMPWLAPSWDVVYYCTIRGIHALDMKTGISRLLRQHNGAWQSVTGVLMEGFVLRCETKGKDGSREVLLIDAQTGESIASGDYLAELKTSGENWYCKVKSGEIQEYLVGGREQVWNLWPAEGAQKLFPLPQKNAVVTYQETAQGCCLSYYDVATGKRTAEVTIPNVKDVGSVSVDARGIWFLAYDAALGAKGICLWNPEASPIEDPKDYRATHYTRENSDFAGLQTLRQNLQALEKTYGIKLLLSDDPMEWMPEHYRFETEYLLQAYEAYLPLLEQALAQFPEGFFQTLAQRTGSGKLNIGLVRRISGAPEEGALPTTKVLQYWLHGDAYLMLTLGGDLDRSFYHGIMQAMETRVLSVTTAFYDWETLNPEGFVYDNDYIKNLDREDGQYLQDGAQWFVNRFAMSYAREDRACTMEYACMAGNERVFQSERMQNKLQMLCKGIRMAFALEEDGKAYLWEQYLSGEA